MVLSLDADDFSSGLPENEDQWNEHAWKGKV